MGIMPTTVAMLQKAFQRYYKLISSSLGDEHLLGAMGRELTTKQKSQIELFHFHVQGAQFGFSSIGSTKDFF